MNKYLRCFCIAILAAIQEFGEAWQDTFDNFEVYEEWRKKGS